MYTARERRKKGGGREGEKGTQGSNKSRFSILGGGGDRGDQYKMFEVKQWLGRKEGGKNDLRAKATVLCNQGGRKQK